MDYTENDLKIEEKKYISTYGCDIFNAISIDGKKKFRNFYFSGIALRKISDILCVENGLSVIKRTPEFIKDIEAKLMELKDSMKEKEFAEYVGINKDIHEYLIAKRNLEMLYM